MLVGFLDDISIFVHLSASIGRVFLIKAPKKHVLKTISGIEYAGTQATGGSLKGFKKDFFPLLKKKVCLLQKSIFVYHTLIQGPGIFRQSQCSIETYEFGEIY
jgi:hypothetical protein